MNEGTRVVREARLFEFYRDYLWPLHRWFVRKMLSARCATCILTERYSEFKDGICLQCREKSHRSGLHAPVDLESARREFDTLVRSVAGRQDVRYHVLILFSGGKDSSYLIHRIKADYPGLRILTLTVDNTFMSPVALNNISEIVKRLAVEHVMFRPETQVMEKMFRYAFTHLNEKGCAGTVDQFDGDFFSDVARNLAADLKIPLIFCGLSPTQAERILGVRWFETKRESEGHSRTHVAQIDLRDIFSDHEMRYWWNGSDRSEAERPHMVFPFFVWRMDESVIRQEVLRLQLTPRGDESPLITNHSLIPLMGLVDMMRLGYSSFEPEFAQMVREGKADRETWVRTFELLEYSAKTGRFIGPSIVEVLGRLKLTRAELGLERNG